MPWSQTSPMDQRTQFIADFLRQVLSVTELCDLYGVSRKTAYKWIERYLRQGPSGLEERSRRPHASPNRTDEAIVAALLEVRRRHPSWGGKKLLALVHKRHRNWDLPHRSTVCDILSRHGMGISFNARQCVQTVTHVPRLNCYLCVQTVPSNFAPNSDARKSGARRLAHRYGA